MRKLNSRCLFVLLVTLITACGAKPDRGIILTALPATSEPAPTLSVAVASPTPSPTPSVAAVSPTPTPQPTAVVLSAASQIFINTLDKPEIGCLALDENGKIVYQQKPYCAANLQIKADSCELIGLDTNQNGNILLDTISFRDGSAVREEIVVPADHRLYYADFNFLLSPDGEWVSYLSPGYDDEVDPRNSKFLYLKLIAREKSGEAPVILAPNGGAPYFGASFSPDNHWVAYADLDENGITQIYRMDLVTLVREQLSHFGPEYQDQRIWQVLFAPDGERLAFSLSDTIGVITLADGQITWMRFSEEGFKPLSYHEIWWNRGGDQIMALLVRPAVDRYEFQLAWFDVQSGNVSHAFPQSTEAQYLISRAFPIKDLDRIVLGMSLISEGEQTPGYWLYDIENGTLAKIKLPYLCCSPYNFAYSYVPLDSSKCKKP